MSLFYEARTWVPQYDEQGYYPAEVYWSGSERGAYVACNYPVTYAFVFGPKHTVGCPPCWQIDKPVSAYAQFQEFNEAKRWAETVYNLNSSTKE